MSRFATIVLAASFLLPVFVSTRATAQSDAAIPFTQDTVLNATRVEHLDEPCVKESLARLQIPFIANESRLDPRVSYYASTFAGTVYVTRDGKIVYSLRGRENQAPPRDRKGIGSGWALIETMVGGKPRPQGDGSTPTHVSYLIGNDPARWRTGVTTYNSVTLGEVWPGVEVRLRAYGGNTEKLFTVGPGANSARIRMQVGGARSLRVNAAGALVAKTGLGDMTFTAPVAYQESAGERREVDVAYEVRGNRYGFRLGAHDLALPVVIDPLLQATYLGGGGFDGANALAIDPITGEVFVAGGTVSTDFPGTAGGAQAAHGGGSDAFVARLNADLTTLNQATYLGGSGDDFGFALAIHPTTGEVFVAGSTASTDFPGTTGGVQPAHGAIFFGEADGFVARLDASLTTLYQATYLGGSDDDFAYALAIHPTTGEVIVVGSKSSAEWPAPGEESSGVDAFIAHLPATLVGEPGGTPSNEIAIRLSGNGNDAAQALAIHPTTGEVFVAGYTSSSDFPGTTSDFPGASDGAQPVFGGGVADGFVARLNATLTTLYQATYLGGGGEDFAYALAIHPITGEVFVTGQTSSTNFPGTTGGAQPAAGGGVNAFIARLSADLTILNQATYLGSGGAAAHALAIHPTTGEVFVAGLTSSTDFPGTTGGAQPAAGGGFSHAFVARFNATLSTLNQATFLAGSDLDNALALAIHPTTGEVIVAGYTTSTDFPGTAGGAQPALDGLYDAFVARLTPDLMAPVVDDLVSLSPILTSFNPAPVSGGPAGTFTITATFKNTSSSSINVPALKVAQLSGGNLLLNADGGPGGVGAKLTPDVGADRILVPGESFTTKFVIGLQHRRQFTFLVDLYGETSQ